MKPVMFKLTTSRGQSNLQTVFIFVSCEEKGCYRIVSLGHLIFDCRSYCGLIRRMQRWDDGRTLEKFVNHWPAASLLMQTLLRLVTQSSSPGGRLRDEPKERLRRRLACSS